MKFFSLLYFLLGSGWLMAQQTISSDKDWKRQEAFLKNAYEAEYVIRVGDVDNLGFGWDEGFDPFCALSTTAHEYPWTPSENDVAGQDRILLSSRYNPKNVPCGQDGYSGAFDPVRCKPMLQLLSCEQIKGIPTIRNAFLQLFIDDFQAPAFCSYFTVTLNDKRFTEAERILNSVNQTGPIGKLVTIPIPEEFFEEIRKGGNLKLMIDERKGDGDGFAIDFVRLLVNRIRENSCKGDVSGRVLDKETQQPIEGALVRTSTDAMQTESDAAGQFIFRQIATGLDVIQASATGYNDGSMATDVGDGNEAVVYLERAKSVNYNGKSVQIGAALILGNILFDQGKSELKPQGIEELKKLLAFLKANPVAEIELSGHTSSEGDAALNRTLSYRRVNACKKYLVAQGIDAGRVVALGFGPDRPVAPNDTETNRAMNRRVELRITRN